jgi:hypothetical protein
MFLLTVLPLSILTMAAWVIGIIFLRAVPMALPMVVLWLSLVTVQWWRLVNSAMDCLRSTKPGWLT